MVGNVLGADAVVRVVMSAWCDGGRRAVFGTGRNVVRLVLHRNIVILVSRLLAFTKPPRNCNSYATSSTHTHTFHTYRYTHTATHYQTLDIGSHINENTHIQAVNDTYGFTIPTEVNLIKRY